VTGTSAFVAGERIAWIAYGVFVVLAAITTMRAR
jgi:hypothetical protein